MWPYTWVFPQFVAETSVSVSEASAQQEMWKIGLQYTFKRSTVLGQSDVMCTQQSMISPIVVINGRLMLLKLSPSPEKCVNECPPCYSSSSLSASGVCSGSFRRRCLLKGRRDRDLKNTLLPLPIPSSAVRDGEKPVIPMPIERVKMKVTCNVISYK